jgi:acyl carrier protein
MQTIDQATITRLRSWLTEVNAQAPQVSLDTRLIDEGVLDSLQMVNFILFIEELRGSELPEAFIQPEYFVSLRIIHDTFFSDSARRV